jgi:hypothetical protein
MVMVTVVPACCRRRRRPLLALASLASTETAAERPSGESLV